MKKFSLLVFTALLFFACKQEEQMQTVDYVDLDRFMGSWYVIAIMPNFIENDAVNGIETYTRGEGNQIKIEYKFRKNTATGKEKIMHPKAEVYDTKSNAEWRVQFIWPLKFPYLVVDLAKDYRYTVIGVPNKKFVWIMSRTPKMNPVDYQNALENLSKLGYDTEKIVKMPQIWPE